MTSTPALSAHAAGPGSSPDGDPAPPDADRDADPDPDPPSDPGSGRAPDPGGAGWSPAPRRLWRAFRPYFALSFALFALGSIAGAALSALVGLETLLGTSLEGMVGRLPEPTTAALALNNGFVLVLLVTGGLTLGLATAAILVYNGLVVGYVGAVAAAEVGPLTIAVGLLPHGVLEIPAILAAAAVAFRFSHQVLGAALGRREDVMTRRELRDAILIFAVALLLIPVAAFVEANVTTELLARVAG